MRWGAVFAGLVALLLAGCDSNTAGDNGDRSNEWSIHVISGRITLKRSTGLLPLNVLAGKPSDLAMSCQPDGQFRVRSETRPETDGKAVDFAVGGQSITLARGERPIDEALLTLLSSDRPISAKFGDVALGPFNPPFDRVTDEFVDQCRRWLKAVPVAVSD